MTVAIKVYTTSMCPYCIQAKQLLQRKGLEFEEVNLNKQPAQARIDLMQQTKHRTVPQIFIGDTFVGGFDQLYALEKSGQLDTIIAE